jgi:hypothetical protein
MHGIEVDDSAKGSAHWLQCSDETVSLYSPQMTQVFSGGFLYEFWQHGNACGMVEMVAKTGDLESMALQAALARVNDQSKVAEKRETDHGTLLIFRDFVNYKANLAATRDVQLKLVQDRFGSRELEEEGVRAP